MLVPKRGTITPVDDRHLNFQGEIAVICFLGEAVSYPMFVLATNVIGSLHESASTSRGSSLAP
jgi:hypothetical protein